MFFVDEPYVSEFFKKTVKDNNIPVVGTEKAKELGLHSNTDLIEESAAIGRVKTAGFAGVYTTSENAIDWISKNLNFSKLPEKIALFKDKLKFRELTESLYPNFLFQGVDIDELSNLNFDQLPLPFVIKPTVGFFSMGVYKVSDEAEWRNAIDSIYIEVQAIKGLYPEKVLDAQTFIIEQRIDGEEYAIDAYFNAEGDPVILGVFKHTFSSDTDVSDRVYTTSKSIIEANIEEFTHFVKQIGNLAKVKNFPVHIELRRNEDRVLLPIEVNPMRFGGWCSTADLSYLAYGFNPYLYYYSQKKPNWEEAFAGKEGKLFSVVVLDNSTGIDSEKIASFDYDKLLLTFEKPIELRIIDYTKYPVFGFVFVETRAENFIELKNILDSDLSEFVLRSL